MLGAITIHDPLDAVLLSAAIQKLLPAYTAQPRQQAALRRLLTEAKALMVAPATVH